MLYIYVTHRLKKIFVDIFSINSYRYSGYFYMFDEKERWAWQGRGGSGWGYATRLNDIV